MKAERMIEILNELTGNPNTVKYKDDVTCSEALTAMQRAVEEETATLRAELERLKQCEAIVRELATTNHYSYVTNSALGEALEIARQWVRENPPHTGR